MTDNLFDRLADLFRGSGPVNWRLAREIAESAAGPAEPVDPWVDEEFRDLTATAARYLDTASRLDGAATTQGILVLDRRAWASRHGEAFRYLAEPLAEKLGGTGPVPDALAPLGPAMVGLQVGGLVGAMSTRVLAGFDVGLPSGRTEPATFVAPNIERFATDHDLDPRQVRLWTAMHEVTHVAAMAVPWIHDQAVMRVTAFVDGLEVDHEGIAARLASLQDPESIERMLAGGDTPGLFGDADGGSAALDEVRALLSVVEGYAEFLVDTVLGGLLPQAPALRAALDRARSEPGEGERMLATMIGRDLQRSRYRQGTRFCAEVARRWGVDAVDRLWEGPETLPTAGDLDDPVGWAARVLL